MRHKLFSTLPPVDRDAGCRQAQFAPWPITYDQVIATRERLRPYLAPTPLRNYPQLDAWVGGDIRVFVKHENHQPTNSFKVRNGLSVVGNMTDAERAKGIVAASTGNHGQGIAYAGRLLGTSVTICVPVGNNPDKNAAIRALGATVIEEGRDFDEALEVMMRIARCEGRVIAHSANDWRVVAGAATLTSEILEQQPDIEVLVLAVGGGSQAVGAMTVCRELKPDVEVYGVQAAGASAIHDSWHACERMTTPAVNTFAEGIASRTTYDLTFPALLEGLSGFLTVTDSEIAESIRVILSTTHNLVEGAGATGVAGVRAMRERLAGRKVGVVFSGGNLDTRVLTRILELKL